MRQIAAEVNTTRAPGVGGEAGDFQDQLAFFVGEQLELLPIGQVQLGNRAVRRQRRRVHHPGVGCHLL